MDKIKAGRKILKLITGAGNENAEEVERLAFVYASIGFNIIDVCAKHEIIEAARSGIIKSGNENNTAICISIGLKDDIHMTKAVINEKKCSRCSKCLQFCPQNAIFFDGEKILIDEKNCIGCAKCISVCPCNSITSESKYKSPVEMLLGVLGDNADCIEFHCNSDNIEQIEDVWKKIKSIYPGYISICIGRKKLSDETIVNLLKKMEQESDKLIIQADGSSMNRGADDYKSTLQAVAFASMLRDNEIKVPIILSGGTNSKTMQLAKECDLNIDGAAFGSYARKLVKEYISQKDFFENDNLITSAINAAKHLAESVLIF